jgi:hypothetical protein
MPRSATNCLWKCNENITMSTSCPHCEYTLSPVYPLKCPECGRVVHYVARKEQAERPARIAFWIAGLSVAVLVAGIVGLFASFRHSSWFILTNKHNLLLAPFIVVCVAAAVDFVLFYRGVSVFVCISKRRVVLFAIGLIMIIFLICWGLVEAAKLSFFSVQAVP